MAEITRRDALRLTAGAVAAMGSVGCTTSTAPEDLADTSGTRRSAQPSTPSPRRELAAVAAVPDGGVVDVTTAAGEPAYLIRSGDSVRLVSATCTHASCRVAWEAGSGLFQCPCHHGTYDSQGQVISGPPPRALEELGVVVENGFIYMDS